MWSDFKKFIFRGNVIDLAVGVIIGGAFGKIVTSLVSDVIMPILGFITAGINFKDLVWVIAPEITKNGEVVSPAVTVAYGNFIQSVVDFLIMSACIFVFIKLFTKVKETAESTARKLKKAEEKQQAEQQPVPEDIALLREIRDLIKEQKK